MKRDLRWLYFVNILPFMICSLTTYILDATNWALLTVPVSWVILGIINYRNTSDVKSLISINATMLASSVINTIVAILLYFSEYILESPEATMFKTTMIIGLSFLSIVCVSVMTVICLVLRGANERNINKRWEEIKKRANQGTQV